MPERTIRSLELPQVEGLAACRLHSKLSREARALSLLVGLGVPTAVMEEAWRVAWEARKALWELRDHNEPQCPGTWNGSGLEAGALPAFNPTPEETASRGVSSGGGAGLMRGTG